MRVYVPATARTLADLVERRSVGPAPIAAFAVTPAVRAAAPGTDPEELAEDAMDAAAAASLGLLAADPGVPRRRAVVAADVPDGAVTETDPVSGSVVVASEIPMARVASVHVDDAGAGPDVAAAAAAWPEPAEAAEVHSLLWYATQELPDLLTSW